MTLSRDMNLPVKQKTLFLSTSFSDSSLYQYFEGLAIAFSEFYDSVYIFLDKQKSGPNPPRANIHYITWPSWKPNRLRDFFFVAKKIMQHRPQCLIGNFTAANQFTLAGALLKVPHRIIWYHTVSEAIPLDLGGLSLRHQLQRLRKKIIYSQNTLIVCNSKYSQRDLNRVYSPASHKTCTLPLLIKEPRRHIVLATNSRKIVLCIGRLVPNKNQKILISQIPEIIKYAPDAQFIFVGGGPEQASLEKLVASLHLKDICQFTGEINTTSVLELYSKAWISVSTSQHEAFGLVNLESLSQGVPVVAFKVGGIPEIIRDGEEGFLISKENKAQLTSKIISLLNSDEIRRKMSEKALSRFNQVFSLEKNALDQVKQLLEMTGQIKSN